MAGGGIMRDMAPYIMLGWDVFSLNYCSLWSLASSH